MNVHLYIICKISYFESAMFVFLLVLGAVQPQNVEHSLAIPQMLKGHNKQECGFLIIALQKSLVS